MVSIGVPGLLGITDNKKGVLDVGWLITNENDPDEVSLLTDEWVQETISHYGDHGDINGEAEYFLRNLIRLVYRMGLFGFAQGQLADGSIVVRKSEDPLCGDHWSYEPTLVRFDGLIELTDQVSFDSSNKLTDEEKTSELTTWGERFIKDVDFVINIFRMFLEKGFFHLQHLEDWEKGLKAWWEVAKKDFKLTKKSDLEFWHLFDLREAGLTTYREMLESHWKTEGSVLDLLSPLPLSYMLTKGLKWSAKPVFGGPMDESQRASDNNGWEREVCGVEKV